MDYRQHLYDYICRELSEYRKNQAPFEVTVKRLILQDGADISIQASHLHYCSPKEKLNDFSQYESFEVCLLKDSSKTNFFRKNISDDGIIPYVPIEKLIDEIEAHGGFVE